MKYKENPSVFYLTLLLFAVSGLLFNKYIFSPMVYIYPIFEILALFLIAYTGKKYAMGSSLLSALLIFSFFVLLADVSTMVPLILFTLYAYYHYATNGDASSLSTVFDNFNFYYYASFVVISGLSYKFLSLMTNNLYITKHKKFFVENEKEVLSLIPNNFENKEYDLVLAGTVGLNKNTETVILTADNLEFFISNNFVLRDIKNGFLGIKKSKLTHSSKDSYLSSDGKILFIENTKKHLLKKKEEVFIYCFYLPDFPESVVDKIYQYLRFDSKNMNINDSTNNESEFEDYQNIDN